MTEMSDGTIVTDIDNHADNYRLTSRGYTIRHTETWPRFELCHRKD